MSTTPVTPSTPPATPDPGATELAARHAEIVDLATRHDLALRAPEWIRSGASLDQVRSAILDELAARDRAAGGHSNRHAVPGRDERELRRDAAVEALLGRHDGRLTVARDNPYRSSTLYDLAVDSVRAAGADTRGMSRMEVVGRAFTLSSSDFPILLEATMHKSLQAGYATAPATWSRWCAIGSVSDFRDHPRYRAGSLPNLQPLTDAGQYVNTPIPDAERARVRVRTMGFIVNLTREAVINDDLGVLTGTAQQMGDAAQRTIEAQAYALLISNPVLPTGHALFSAAHANIGGAGALSAVTVDAARSLMASQTGVGGQLLDLRPSVWLGPVGLGGQARVINDPMRDPTHRGNAHVAVGVFTDIIDTPRLPGTVWYALAAARQAPVIEVAFLDGAREPQVDTEEGFSADGIRWRIRLDFGAAVIDHRGAVRNPGA